METASIIEAVVGAILGGVAATVGLYWRIRHELEADYDKDLRAERLKVYAGLWKLLQPLARYARPAPVTPSSLETLSIELRRWYFEVGGIFMSEMAREAYFALQGDLETTIAAGQGDPDRHLSGPDFESIRRKGSRLRTAMTLDIGSRRKPLLGDGGTA